VIAWNTSLTYASAASATLLGNTSSVIVALVAWLIFREKLRGKFWLGLFIAVAGGLPRESVVARTDHRQNTGAGWYLHRQPLRPIVSAAKTTSLANPAF
jgi:hypothetical protein